MGKRYKPRPVCKIEKYRRELCGNDRIYKYTGTSHTINEKEDIYMIIRHIVIYIFPKACNYILNYIWSVFAAVLSIVISIITHYVMMHNVIMNWIYNAFISIFAYIIKPKKVNRNEIIKYNGTHFKPYHEHGLKAQCPICWEEEKSNDYTYNKWTKLKCGHLFHIRCIKQWADYQQYNNPICVRYGYYFTCPNCRSHCY
jgi:hypothetical protein